MLKAKHALRHLCDIARVSRSGYYAWKKAEVHRIAKEKADIALLELINTLIGNKIGIYGYRNVQMKLEEYGHTINHKRLRRVMKAYGIQARIRIANPYKRMMKKTQEHRTCPNLLDRNFAQQVPEQVAGTDITYLWIAKLKRFVYLSAIKDFASGEILAHVLSHNLSMPLVLDTIAMLSERLKGSTKGFMLHSDQGFHCTNPVYQTKLKKLEIVQSMSRKGNCIDNAAMETFFGHMKDEIDMSQCVTFNDVQIEVATYISYYNETRRQWHRKKMTPIEYRNHLFSTVV